MKEIITTVIISIFSIALFAQTEATISGRIFEKETTEPLPFATIVLNGLSSIIS